MLVQAVFLTALLCAVKASVVVNIFDDDVDTLRSSVEGCNLRWCEQQCRRMGFPGGACVGDRCKCDTRNSIENELEDVESCDPHHCSQQCHRMGFPGGECDGYKCKCHKKTELKIQTIEIPTIGLCNELWCDERCRDHGYQGGTCLVDSCECYIIKPLEIKVNTVVIPVEGACNASWCTQQCQQYGYRGGTCFGDRCECYMNKPDGTIDNEIPTDETSEESDEIDLTGEIAPTESTHKHCRPIHCFQSCRRRGRQGGVCTPLRTCICY